MVLTDLIPSLIDHGREAVNDPCSHFDNRMDGVNDKVGYVMIERTIHLTASDMSLVVNQVNSRRSVCAGGCTIIVIPQWRSISMAGRHISIEAHDPTAERLKLFTHFPPGRFKHVID